MDKLIISREPILQALREVLEPLDYTYAMWEGGAAAFDRVDEWSDIDLMVDVEDDFIDATFQVIGSTLEKISPVEMKYEILQPTLHGYAQAFYRLKDTSPYLLLDICVLKHSIPEKFLEPQMHGAAKVFFDKAGVIQSSLMNKTAQQEQLKARTAILRMSFELFQTFILKELNRGNAIEAINFYMGYTLKPLVEALRIIYQPDRYSFNTRYVYYDLPEAVIARLEPLYFVKDTEDLRLKRQQAEEWFNEVVQ